MSIWQDNAARFATTRDDVDHQVDVVLANLQADLRWAGRRHRLKVEPVARLVARRRAAVDAAAVSLARLDRASGRAGVRTFELTTYRVGGRP